MKAYRMSLAGLMLMIVCCGVGVAAVRSPTEVWASSIYTLTLAALGLTIPGVIYRKGARRAFWIGFATFGIGYWVASSATWIGELTARKLITRQLIEQYHESMTWRDAKPAAIEESTTQVFNEGIGRTLNQKLSVAVRFQRNVLRQPGVDANSPELQKANDDVLEAKAAYDAGLSENRPLIVPEAIRRIASRTSHPHLTQIGHCLFTLIVGYLGGIIGLIFHRTRDEIPCRNDDRSTITHSTT